MSTNTNINIVRFMKKVIRIYDEEDTQPSIWTPSRWPQKHAKPVPGAPRAKPTPPQRTARPTYARDNSDAVTAPIDVFSLRRQLALGEDDDRTPTVGFRPLQEFRRH